MSSKQNTPVLSQTLIFLLAAAVAAIVANLYYTQPIVSMISQSLGLSKSSAGLVVMMVQAGYGLGVLLIVPLADILENRKMVLTLLLVLTASLLGLAFSDKLIPYFLAALATGMGACTVQVIVPYVAHFAPEEKRGQVVGTLMSGLMIGIMSSRPIASLITDFFSWHAVFVVSAVLMLTLAAVLYKVLPERQPQAANLRYKDVLKSLIHLFTTTEVLRRRAFYQATLFAAFCLFWTASPLLLMSDAFHLSQTQIALFAIVGISGAVAAPFAGRYGDRGFTQLLTAVSLSVASLSFLLIYLFDLGSTASLIALVISAILLDAAVTCHLVLGQRALFSLAPEIRGRLNGLYVATIFVGGALGSFLGAWSFAEGGWRLTGLIGFVMPLLALVYFLTEVFSARLKSYLTS